MGLVFYLSSIEGNGVKLNPDFWFYAQRKGAHVFEYAVLTLLIFRAVFMGMKNNDKLFYKLILVIFLSLLYAFSDEIHQTFVFGREGKLPDVGIDLIGILIASFLIYKLKENKTFRKLLSF